MVITFIMQFGNQTLKTGFKGFEKTMEGALSVKEIGRKAFQEKYPGGRVQYTHQNPLNNNSVI